MKFVTVKVHNDINQ